jgi:hypothetical protein
MTSFATPAGSQDSPASRPGVRLGVHFPARRTTLRGVRRVLLLLTIAAVTLGSSVAVGSARTGGIVPKALVGAYDTYLPTKKPTVKGHWVIAIGRHGSFVITTPLAEVLAVGPVSVNGSTITLPPDRGRGGLCTTPGVYTWQVAGKVLTFARVDDGCAERVRRLTSRPWNRFTGYDSVIIIQK